MASGFRRSAAAEFPSGFDDVYLAFHFRVDVTPDCIAQTPRRTRNGSNFDGAVAKRRVIVCPGSTWKDLKCFPRSSVPFSMLTRISVEQGRGEAMGHGILVMNHDRRVV